MPADSRNVKTQSSYAHYVRTDVQHECRDAQPVCRDARHVLSLWQTQHIKTMHEKAVVPGTWGNGFSVLAPYATRRHFLRVTVYITFPSLSIMCRQSSFLSAETREKPVALLQKRVPSIGFTSRLNEPDVFTT